MDPRKMSTKWGLSAICFRKLGFFFVRRLHRIKNTIWPFPKVFLFEDYQERKGEFVICIYAYLKFDWNCSRLNFRSVAGGKGWWGLERRGKEFQAYHTVHGDPTPLSVSLPLPSTQPWRHPTRLFPPAAWRTLPPPRCRSGRPVWPSSPPSASPPWPPTPASCATSKSCPRSRKHW